MTRRYYSSRTKGKHLSLRELYWKLQNLFSLFQKRDYFKGKAGVTDADLPDAIKHEAAIALTFQPFPIDKWAQEDITEDRLFDTIEFLYDHVSKPGEWIGMTNGTGWNYNDYDSYDDEAGQEEFRNKANAFIAD